MYYSTKTYGNDRGLSCCFRQWRATHSHCSTLHGYSIGVKFVFQSETLDERNWCFDFGNMKPIKEYLDHMFDHTMLIAEDDPLLPMFRKMATWSSDPEYANEFSILSSRQPYEESRVVDLRIVPSVGCEGFAKQIYEAASVILDNMRAGTAGRYKLSDDIHLKSVEVFEHGANSAIYEQERI